MLAASRIQVRRIQVRRIQKGNGLQMVDLLQSRDAIDTIDREIVRLFEERMKIAADVAEYKMQTGKKIYDKEREEEKLKSLSELAHNDFNKHGIVELFTQIMSMSRKYQYGLLSALQEPLPFVPVDKIQVDESTKVICFGERGSYTEQAMEEYFGLKPDTSYGKSFRSIMESVKNGDTKYGVLPIENTSTGGIADIYDLLTEYNNVIIGEHVIKVEHALLGLQGAKLDTITKVYSHPQALMQCDKFIQSHNITPVTAVSTADSAVKIIEENVITTGAIASERAAHVHGLQILARAINKEQTNATRFIIIAKERVYLKNSNKVSICFELPHTSGSLYNMLSHFIYNNLSMTKIESRPLEGRNFEYRFFVDFEGNLQDAGVCNALSGIKEEAVDLKILGNYGLLGTV